MKKTPPTQNNKKNANITNQKKEANSKQSVAIKSKSPTPTTTIASPQPPKKAKKKNSSPKAIYALIASIFVLTIIGFSITIYNSNRQRKLLETQLNNIQNPSFQLAGDPAWISSRQWEVSNADNQVIATSNTDGQFNLNDVLPGSQFTIKHADWKINFVGQVGDSPQGGIDLSLGEEPQVLPLDRNLDKFAQQFTTDIVQKKWSNIAAYVDLGEDKSATGSTEKFLSVQFNDWARGLAIKNIKLDDISVLYNLNKDRSMDGRLVLIWTLTNQNTGEKNLITTNLQLAKTDNEQEPYKWVFNMGAFPRI